MNADDKPDIPDWVNFHVEVNLRRLFEDADNQYPGENLLQAISWCCSQNIPLPEWVRNAFREGYWKYREYISTTEEAFQLSPRTHLKSKRKRQYASLVWQRVNQLRAEGWAVGEELYELVAEEVNEVISGNPEAIKSPQFADTAKKTIPYLSASTVEQLYLDFCRRAIKDTK